MQPKISIIILNRNGWEDTIECLESLYRNDYTNYEVLLVDNNSTNESIEKILARTRGEIEVSSKYFDTTYCTHEVSVYQYTKQQLDDGSYVSWKQSIDQFPSNKKLFLLQNDDNYGFAEGNNIAMRQILKEWTSEYVLLLNNDTTVASDFLTCLVADGAKQEKLWMIAPVNYNYYDWSIDFYGWDINRWLWKPYHLKKENTRKTYQFLTWCCLLIPLHIIAKTWWFDPIYFCYFEDADLSQEIIGLWFDLHVSTCSKIYHKINASSGSGSDFFVYQFARNRIIFIKKYIKNMYCKYISFLILQCIIKTIAMFFLRPVKLQKRISWVADGLKYQ